MTSVDDVPSGGDTDRILDEALRLAQQIWTNEDRNVQRRPGYDPAFTVASAVQLAGAVIGLDAPIRTGKPIPLRWGRRRSRERCDDPSKASPDVRLRTTRSRLHRPDVRARRYATLCAAAAPLRSPPKSHGERGISPIQRKACH
jgi:hypothetical protein